jgi:hypothetical protein
MEEGHYPKVLNELDKLNATLKRHNASAMRFHIGMRVICTAIIILSIIGIVRSVTQ